MINHVIFFRLKDSSDQGKAVTRDVLLNMEGKIPGLLSVEVGENIVPSARAYDLILITKFATLEDLDVYQVHPVHKEVIAHMAEALREPSVAVDYETNH